MKVLYIGHYRDVSGWARAAIDYILAMDRAGIDVVCRPVKLNQSVAPVDPRIEELERKDSSGCNICIQHVLPHHLDYNGHFDKNIALYATETSNFFFSSWGKKINCMDEAWVINQSMVESSRKSGVDIPIKVIPHTCEISKFEQSVEPIDIGEYNSNFIFYFIGEANKRKNLPALIRAFNTEFTINEPVTLLLKVNKYGAEREELNGIISSLCADVKTGLKLYGNPEFYPKEIIITGYMSEDQILSLHHRGDCFVAPSHGEAWCIPAFDAMALGNTPICSRVGGMIDFLKDGGGVLVDGSSEPVFGMLETFQDIYTGREDWFNIDTRSLQKEMRSVYESWKNKDESYLEMQREGIEIAEKYSYESIGSLIKQELENAN